MQFMFLDESGKIGKNSPDRFFVIGGVYVNGLVNVAKLRNAYKKMNKELKKVYNLKRKYELKASSLKISEEKEIIYKFQEIDGVYVCALVIDQSLVTFNKRSMKIYYDFMVRKLIDYLIKKN